MDKISLLLPTKHRSERFVIAVESFIGTAKKPEELEIVVGIEIADRETILAFNQIKRKYENINWKLMLFEGDIFLIEKYNMLYNIAEHNIIFGIADDNIMTTLSWDSEIRKMFDESKDKIICCVINDGIHSDNLYRHFAIHKKWCEAVGYYMNKNFKHYYIDNIITGTSRTLKRDYYMKHIVMDHKHPVFGTAAVDQTYVNDYNLFNVDREAFEKYAESIVRFEVNTLSALMIN